MFVGAITTTVRDHWRDDGEKETAARHLEEGDFLEMKWK